MPLEYNRIEPVRVTHSIPDCCGLIMRSEHGTIVHTGEGMCISRCCYVHVLGLLKLVSSCARSTAPSCTQVG